MIISFALEFKNNSEINTQQNTLVSLFLLELTHPCLFRCLHRKLHFQNFYFSIQFKANALYFLLKNHMSLPNSMGLIFFIIMMNLLAYSISSNNKKESSKLLRNKLDFLKIIISAVIRLIKVSNKLICLSLERLIYAKLMFIQHIYSSDYFFYCYSFEEDMFHFSVNSRDQRTTLF